MKPNPYLDFFEKELPQHVSRALGNRLASRRDKTSKLAPKDDEQSPAHDAADAPEGEEQEDSGIPGASQEDDAHSAVPPAPRKVYMMPSEKLERKTLQKRQPPKPSLKPRVIR